MPKLSLNYVFLFLQKKWNYIIFLHHILVIFFKLYNLSFLLIYDSCCLTNIVLKIKWLYWLLYLFIFVANFCQFKGSKKSTKDFFGGKKSNYVKLKLYIVNFLQQIIVGNHNIEIFKQVSNFTTCL